MSENNNTQSRKWQLTINNPADCGLDRQRIIDLLQRFRPAYFCMADEIATTGTLHTHVYLFSHSPIRFTTIKNRFPTAHIEKASGTARENRDYIRKEGKWEATAKVETRVPGTFLEYGELPTDAEENAPKMYQVLREVVDTNTQSSLSETGTTSRPCKAISATPPQHLPWMCTVTSRSRCGGRAPIGWRSSFRAVRYNKGKIRENMFPGKAKPLET